MNRGDYVTIIEIIHTKFRVVFLSKSHFFYECDTNFMIELFTKSIFSRLKF